MAENKNVMDMMEANAVGHRSKPSAPELDHIRLIPADGGGHIVQRHMKSGAPEKPRVFAKSEGKELMAHLAEHGKIEVGKPEADEDSAAGAAT